MIIHPFFCDISSGLCRAGISETPPALRATSPIFVPFRFSKTKEELAPLCVIIILGDCIFAKV